MLAPGGWPRSSADRRTQRFVPDDNAERRESMPENPVLDPDADPKGAEGKEGAFKPPSDGSWIPRERFNEVNATAQRERDRASRLEAELAALRTKPAEPARPPVTRAELQTLVDEGKLSSEQMDAEVERQIESRVEARILSQVDQRTKAQRRADTVSSELQRYKEVIPALTQDGSEERGRVQKEFQYLVERLGEPADTATELKAVRAVFGPSERIREITRETREADPETLGGGGAGGNGANNGVFTGLTQTQRTAYQAMIDRGLYTGPDDPNLKKEIQIASSRARQRQVTRA